MGLAPVANFDAHYAYKIVPTTVGFIDRSTGTDPVSSARDFGDGHDSVLKSGTTG